MVPRLSGIARLLAALALASAVPFVGASLPLAADADMLQTIADDNYLDDGAGADPDSQADRPAQRQPDTDEPSEDGTDGATGGNSAEPPSGCMLRDGPLELLV